MLNMEQKDLDKLNDIELMRDKYSLATQLEEEREMNKVLLQILADMSHMSVDRLKNVFKYEMERKQNEK